MDFVEVEVPLNAASSEIYKELLRKTSIRRITPVIKFGEGLKVSKDESEELVRAWSEVHNGEPTSLNVSIMAVYDPNVWSIALTTGFIPSHLSPARPPYATYRPDNHSKVSVFLQTNLSASTYLLKALAIITMKFYERAFGKLRELGVMTPELVATYMYSLRVSVNRAPASLKTLLMLLKDAIKSRDRLRRKRMWLKFLEYAFTKIAGSPYNVNVSTEWQRYRSIWEELEDPDDEIIRAIGDLVKKFLTEGTKVSIVGVVNKLMKGVEERGYQNFSQYFTALSLDYGARTFLESLALAGTPLENQNLLVWATRRWKRAPKRRRIAPIIIGAGGVGWWAGEWLNWYTDVEEGIIIDFDQIEPHNFNRLPISIWSREWSVAEQFKSSMLSKYLNMKASLMKYSRFRDFENSWGYIIDAADERLLLEQLNRLQREGKDVVVIEATDSPKFQMKIKEIWRKRKIEVPLIQAHYEVPKDNMSLYGFVSYYPSWRQVPEVGKEEVESASDYAEGQALALPAAVVGKVAAFLAIEKPDYTINVGPFIYPDPVDPLWHYIREISKSMMYGEDGGMSLLGNVKVDPSALNLNVVYDIVREVFE